MNVSLRALPEKQGNNPNINERIIASTNTESFFAGFSTRIRHYFCS